MEPEDYDTVTVTLEIARPGWEVIEQFAALHKCAPMHLVEQAVAKRIRLCAHFLEQIRHEETVRSESEDL